MEIEDEEESSSREVAVIEDDDDSETAAEPVAPLEPVTVPIVALKAALSCTGEKRTEASGKKSDIPASMQGVNIASREGEIRITSTDGRRLFAYSVGVSKEETLPGWLADGVTVSIELLKEQLAMIEKVGGENAVVSYQTSASQLLLSDPHNRVTFRTFPVADKFPDYGNVLSGIDLSARTTVDLESTGYQAGYLRGVADLAKVLGSMSVQIFASAGVGKPTLIIFPGMPGATLVLMPLVEEAPAPIHQSTMRVLAGPIAGTLAALRAHRTRWEKKLAKSPSSRAIQKKIEEYDQRIDAIIGRTAQALPAPETASESDEEALMRLSQPERPVSFVPKADWSATIPATEKETTAWVEAETAPATEAETVAGAAEFLGTRLNRAKLKGAVATKAKARFNADVNAVLSRDNNGLTIHQLADGVPLDSWWETGLSAEQAAVRCLDWRTKSTMLPPDEVGPGEEFERASPAK